AEKNAREGKPPPAAPAAGARPSKGNGQPSAPPRLSAREREKRTAAVEAEIHKLELQLVQLSGDLGAASEAGQVDKVRALGEAYTSRKAELDARMEEWETLLASQ